MSATSEKFGATYDCLRFLLPSVTYQIIPSTHGRLKVIYGQVKFFLAPAVPGIFPGVAPPESGVFVLCSSDMFLESFNYDKFFMENMSFSKSIMHTKEELNFPCCENNFQERILVALSRVFEVTSRFLGNTTSFLRGFP